MRHILRAGSMHTLCGLHFDTLASSRDDSWEIMSEDKHIDEAQYCVDCVVRQHGRRRASMCKSASTHFVLADAFDIDHGEFAALPPEPAFVLGVEWEAFRRTFDAWDQTLQGEFCCTVHAENKDRLKMLMLRRGYRAEFDEIAAGWVTITVRGRPGKKDEG